jgi:flagellar biosynthesis/type III secretory pathway protein FliH
MKIPYMDTTGKVRFPHDKHISKEEFEAYFAPKQEDTDVGDHGHTTDHHDSDSDLVREAEQTADLAENDRQRADKLWNRGWRRGHRDGYQDGYQDAVDNMAKRGKSDGDD